MEAEPTSSDQETPAYTSVFIQFKTEEAKQAALNGSLQPPLPISTDALENDKLRLTEQKLAAVVDRSSLQKIRDHQQVADVQPTVRVMVQLKEVQQQQEAGGSEGSGETAEVRQGILAGRVKLPFAAFDVRGDVHLPDDWLTGVIERKNLQELRQNPYVARVEVTLPAGDHKPHVEKSPWWHRVKPPHEAEPLRTTTSETGEGATVVIIDSGIHIQHRAFQNPDGTTRLFAIYDQIGNRTGRVYQKMTLRLLPKATLAEIPETGTSEVIIAELDSGLHLRVFNDWGEMVGDLPENKVSAENRHWAHELREFLGEPFPAELPPEKEKWEWEIIRIASSLVDHIPGLYLKRDIDKMLVDSEMPGLPFQSNMHHGTMVASIAAGSEVKDSDGNILYAGGVAPKADIVFICCASDKYEGEMERQLGYSLSHVMVLQYLKRLARHPQFHRVGQGLVLNMSFGEQVGAHDGSTLLESQISAFCGEGRDSGVCVVKSAGNDGGRGGHTSVKIGANRKATIDLKLIEDSSYYSPPISVELWYRSCFPMEIAAIVPGGETVALKVDETAVAQKRMSEQKTVKAGNTVFIDANRYNSDNGETRATVQIQPGDHGFVSGNWKIRLSRLPGPCKSTALVDAWLDLRQLRRGEPEAVFVSPDKNAKTLSIPGTADHIITVGAVKNADYPRVMAEFSSQGPSRDGLNKPEIGAPGMNVRGARYYSPDEFDTGHGTSFAAPQVTGAIALLFAKKRREGKPLPNAMQIKAALIHSSQGYNGDFKPDSGYGMLDIDKFLAEL